MKTLAIFISFIIFSGHFGEDQGKVEKYCAALRDGVMVLTKDGMVVTSDVTINDSIKVTPDCVVIKKDGTKINLKDGECINQDSNKVDLKKKN